ncbi:hypothetical protein ACFQZC_26130 [Streptacidiphilus monticola]
MTEEDEGSAAAWWEYVRLSSGSRQERLRADDHRPVADQVAEVVAAGGPRALALVLRLLDARPQDGDLAVLAAGPWRTSSMPMAGRWPQS